MDLNDIHSILFNANILFSVIMGIWAAVMAAQNQSISGSFWGAVVTLSIQAGLVMLVGGVMFLQGLRPPRPGLYFLYMAWLVIIMPGLFTMLRGRDDRQAAIAFAILAFFNASTAASMAQRMVVGPWA